MSDQWDVFCRARPVRVRKALSKLGVTSFDVLAGCSTESLMACRNFGEGSLAKLNAALLAAGRMPIGQRHMASYKDVVEQRDALLAACELWDQGFIDGEQFDPDQFLAWVNKNRRAAREAIAAVKGTKPCEPASATAASADTGSPPPASPTGSPSSEPSSAPTAST